MAETKVVKPESFAQSKTADDSFKTAQRNRDFRFFKGQMVAVLTSEICWRSLIILHLLA